MFIIKLKPSKTSSITFYYQIQGYTIVLSQNLGPLLIILLLNNLAPHDVICIIWINKCPYTTFNIYVFINV